MMNYQVFQFKDFSGGISDNFIDTAVNRYEYADNFLVTENARLYTRPGSTIWDSSNPQIPAGAQRINAFISNLNQSEILTVSAKKAYYISSGAWATLQGPTGNDAFSVGDIYSRVISSPWNKHIYFCNDDFSPVMKAFRDNSGNLKLRSAGLPEFASTPVCTPSVAGSNNYIYAFAYYDTYTVGTVVFVDYGPVNRVQVLLSDAPDSNHVDITGIPVLSNGTTQNYNTSGIKVKIFRTINNGTTFFYLGEVTNGVASFVDTVSDTTLANNSVLYTDSGELDHEAPPLCKAMHITDTTAYYGHIKLSSGEVLSNRVRQSIPDDPDSAPGALYVDLDDDIVAISSVGQTPVVLCEKEIYRLDGSFTALGEGELVAQKIESTVGCISANSVVQIQRGIVFAGEGGFYFTDGWEVRKLSQAFNDRYKSFTATARQRERIYGAFDRMTKRVYWSVQESTDSGDDVNKIYILDTRYGLGVAGDDLENVNVCFTNMDNSSYFAPTALLFKDGELIRADKRGYIFVHREGYESDPRIDTSKAYADWDIVAIPWRFRSMATSFGTSMQRKFIPKLVFTAENETNISVQINSINDIGRQNYSLTPLRFRKNCVWNDPTPTWGDDVSIWDFHGIIEEQRYFQSEGLRCSYKQVEITNAYVQIVSSDNLGTVTVDGNADIVVLDDSVNYIWPNYMVDYYISFPVDGYVREYLITSRTNDTLGVADPTNTLPSLTSTKFSIKGYPKNEILNLISIAMDFAYLGGPQDYNKASAGSEPT